MKMITPDFVRANNESNSAFIVASNPQNGKQVITSVFQLQPNGYWYDTEQQVQTSVEQMCDALNNIGKYLEQNGAVAEIAMGFPDESVIYVSEFEASPEMRGKKTSPRKKRAVRKPSRVNIRPFDEVQFYETAFKRMI